MGVGLALLMPAVGVAALSLPNVFKAGAPVSAAEMNANFDAVSKSVTTLEAKKPGLPKGMPQILTYDAPAFVFKTSATGTLYAKPGSTGFGTMGVQMTVGDMQDPVDATVVKCGGNSCSIAARSVGGNSTSLLVPADAYVSVQANYTEQVPAEVYLYWQPADATAGALPMQVYPP